MYIYILYILICIYIYVLSFSATLVEHWNVKFWLGLAKALNNIDSNNGIQISPKNTMLYIYVALKENITRILVRPVMKLH